MTDQNSKPATDLPGKALVIGLDGATWRLLDRFIQRGDMPVLSRLCQEGTRGDLASTLPFLSPIAWTSMATGMYPGKHRVFGFFNPRYTYVWAPRLDQPTRPVSAAGIGALPLYRALNRHGRTTGLIMVPVTHPPQPLRGYIVGDGLLTPNEQSNYTYPPALKADLLAAVPEFHVRPYEHLHHRPELIDEIGYYLEHQGHAARWLMRNHPTDFTMVVFTATDVLQHRFWKYVDPASSPPTDQAAREIQAKLTSFYRLIDRIVGELLTEAGPETVTVLVSDHGFTAPRRIFFVNRWLHEQGLLHFVESASGKLKTRLVNHGLTQERLFGLLKKLDVLNLRQRLRGRDHLGGGVAVRQGIQSITAPEIDWTQTRAYAGNLGEPYVYINLADRDPSGIVQPGEEYEQLCSSLCAALANLRDPANGQCVVRKVYRAAELYPGPYVHEAPDIILDFQEASLVTSDAVQVNAVFADDTTQRGVHDPYGIFLLHGPGVQGGARIENARIVDVMPTMLHLLGVPLPEGLDGHVLTEALAEPFLSQRPVRYAAPLAHEQGPDLEDASSYSDEESGEIEQRLRDLGYIT